MKIKSVKYFLACASMATASLFTSASFAETYSIDSAHSIANFSVVHLGLAQVHGRFNDVSGNFAFANENFEDATVNVTIKANSVDSNHQKRDQHLRSPDFFDAKQFPEITFTSTEYKGDKTSGLIEGNLTMHGITKKVSFQVKTLGAGDDPWGGYRMGFLVEGQIKRSDFGVDYFIPGVSDEVQIVFSVEGVRQ